MLRYFLIRLAGAVPTLFIIVTLSFFLIRAAPGGPFDQEQTLPPEIMANLQSAYGLDQPVWAQYVRYMRGVLHGDFGPSFRYKDFTVTELIAASSVGYGICTAHALSMKSTSFLERNGTPKCLPIRSEENPLQSM